MKTIKINEITHKQLTETQAYLYKEVGNKFTFDKIISWAISKALTTYIEEHSYDK